MPIKMVITVPGMSGDVYDQVSSQVESSLKAAPGFISHAGEAGPDGTTVTELWDSRDQWQEYFDSTVRPNLPPDVPAADITEVRNVIYPAYEKPEFEAANFLQGIAGTLELFHRSTLSFQDVAGELTGHPVAVFQRVDQAGYAQPIDERILDDTDTLMVFGLDHLTSGLEVTEEEVGFARFMLEYGRAIHVIVEGRYGLAWVYGAEYTERRSIFGE